MSHVSAILIFMHDFPSTTTEVISLSQLRQKQCLEKSNVKPHKAVAKSGLKLLDSCLPQQGWSAGVVELLLDTPASGELALLMPTLCALQITGRRAAFVNPPAIPYAPGLLAGGIDLTRLVVLNNLSAQDAAWACEQLLQSPSCGAVIAWFDPKRPQSVRRLQLQAKAQGNLLFMCRPLSALRQSSVAQARIQLSQQPEHLQLTFHKLQGEIRRPELLLSWSSLTNEGGVGGGA